MDLNLKCVVCNKDLYPNQHDHYLVVGESFDDRLVHICCGKNERPRYWSGCPFSFYKITTDKKELTYSFDDCFNVDPDYEIIEDISTKHTTELFNELPSDC